MPIPTTLNNRTQDLAASLWAWLAAQAGVTAQVPVGRWLLPGDEDQDSDTWDDWLEPVLIDTPGAPSRGSGELRVLLDVGIGVRPSSGSIYRREVIADALVKVLANARVLIQHTDDGALFTDVGILRMMDPRVVFSRGKVDGLYRATVTVSGYVTPA